MSETPRLKLPLLAAEQSQKHVTHNEALALLDALSGIIQVRDRDLAAPPVGPADGDIYILAGAGSGAWAGYAAGDLAWAIDGAWRRIIPSTGMIAAVADEAGLLVYRTALATWSTTLFGLGSAALTSYEFGSFVPRIEGVTTPGTPTYDVQTGSYVKIGRHVLAQLRLVVNSLGGATGQLRIAGFPVTRAGGNQHRAVFTPAFWGGLVLPTDTVGLAGFMQDTGNTARLIRPTMTSGSNPLTHAEVSGLLTIYGGVNYEADV